MTIDVVTKAGSHGEITVTPQLADVYEVGDD